MKRAPLAKTLGIRTPNSFLLQKPSSVELPYLQSSKYQFEVIPDDHGPYLMLLE